MAIVALAGAVRGLVPAAGAWAVQGASKAVKGAEAAIDVRDLGIIAGALLVLALLWALDVIRPGSLQRRGRREVRAVPAAVWICCGLILFLAPQMAGAAASTLPAKIVGARGSIRWTGTTGLIAYGAGLTTAAFLLYLLRPHGGGGGGGRGGDQAGLRVRWMDAPIGLVCLAAAGTVVLAANLVCTLVVTLVTHHWPPSVAHEALGQIIANRGSPWVWAPIAMAVIGAPIVEEVTYRVFLQSGLAAALGNKGLAVAIAAAAFAAVHAGPVPPYVLPVLFVLGAGLGVAYERTGRLGVPIVMHMGFNAANVWMALKAA